MPRGNVRVSIDADVSGLKRGVDKANRELGSLNKSVGTLKNVAGGLAGYFAVDQVIDFAKSSVLAYQDVITVNKQTEAVLKSTGRAAGISKKEIQDLAAAIQKKTAIDDQQIQSAENLLLTFTKIGKDVFPDATKAVVDMSVALGQDFKSSSIQVGKALNDPIKGVTALRRVGVSFTADQIKQIEVMVKTGKTMEAQKLILRELNREFGGSAQKAVTPLKRMQDAIGELKERIGKALYPAVQDAARAITDFINSLQGGTKNARRFRSTMDDLTATFKDVRSAIKSVSNAIQPVTSRVLPALGQAASGVAQTFRGISRVVSRVFKGDIPGALDGAKTAVSGFLRYMVGAVKAFTAPMRAAGAALGRALSAGLRGALNFGQNIANGVIKLLNDAIPNSLGPINLPDNPIPGVALGGAITGGVPGKDSVLRRLMPGEHVLTAREVQNAGGHSAIFAMRRALGGGTQARGVGMAAGGAVGSHWDWARNFAKRFGLRITSSYRSPAHNRAVGGVEGSWHTRGSAANPEAFDFVPPSSAALAAVRGMGFNETLIHDAGSGLHLHVGGFPASFSGGGGRSAGRSGGGKKMTVGITVFGSTPGDDNGVGYKGDDLANTNDTWAELGKNGAIGNALGGLPYLTKIRVTVNGRSHVLTKRDIGRGGGAVKGHPRAVDLHWNAARRFGVGRNWSGVGTIEILDGKGTAKKGKKINKPKVTPKRPEGTFSQRMEGMRETNYTIAQGTPGNVDDARVALEGKNYWQGVYDRAVTRYNKSPTVENSAAVARASQQLATWSDRYSSALISPDVGGAIFGPDSSDSSSGGGDLQASIAALNASIAEMNARAKAGMGLERRVIAQAVADMAMGQVGGPVLRGIQSPSFSGVRY